MSNERNIVLFNTIDEALKLDSVGNRKLAYCKYLDGIRILCMHLIEQENNSGGIPSTVEGKRKAKQIISVLRRCIERLESLVDENDDGHHTKQMKVENINVKKKQPQSHPSQQNNFNEQHKIISGTLQSNVSRSNGVLELPNSHHPLILVPSVKSRHHMSAMEQAQKENALLYYAYEKRIAQPTDRSNRISLQLELQRRMAENLALAKSKDAAYRQEEMKKEKKALEIAARKLFRKEKNWQSKPEKIEDKKDWQKQWLYAQMLQFEDQEPWPSSLRKRLKDDPEQTAEAIQNTLSTPDYPLVEWMLHAVSNIQHKIQNVLDKHSHCMLLLIPNMAPKVQPVTPNRVTGENATLREMDGNVLSMFDPLLPTVEASAGRKLSNVEILHHELLENSLRCQLNNIIIDITNLTDTVVQLISLSYEISSNFQDLCYQLVEENVYNFLWWKLQVIFRMCNEETERRISQSIKHMQNINPDEMDVPHYFSRLPPETSQEIVVHLQSVTRLYTPISKLKALVEVVEKVNEYSESQAQLNADDLISIIIYLIVQSELPQLMSECDALDCLVPHVFLMGEEGFVLTTFQTALKYLETQMDSVYPENEQLL